MEGPADQKVPHTMMERNISDGEMVLTTEHNEKNNDSEEVTCVPVESEHGKDSLTMNTGLLPFPDNLMSLLDSGVVSDIIRWLPEGDAFCLKPALFAERVLDKFFQGTKFESFTRKLNRWGFKRVAGQKVPPNTIAYYHKDFIRGSPKLLKNMNGGKAKNASAREKILRAQHKLDEDNDALMIASSQFQRSKKLEESNNGQSGLKTTDSHFGLVGSMDQSRLQLLSSNSLALEQELQNRKLQQQLLLRNQPFQNHYYNASQALALQQQRDEAQMAFLLQQRGLQAMRDSNSNTTFAQNQYPSMPIGNNALSALQYSRLPQEPSFPAGIDLSNAGRLLLSQHANANGMGNNAMNNNSINSVLQRLLESRAESNVQESLAASNNLNLNDTAAASTGRLTQQQMLDRQRQVAVGSSTTQSDPGTGTTTINQQLIELYLLQQQQRKNEPSSASNS